MNNDTELISLKNLIKKQLGFPNSLNYKKLISGGIDDSENITKESFINNCPFTVKSEITQDHLETPPFGSNLTSNINSYTKLSKTSGTTGNSISWIDTTDDWNSMLDAWSIIFEYAELDRIQDSLFFAFSFGPFLGFWTAYEAASKLNFMTIPGGGMSSRARLKLLSDSSSSVLFCTPTYALRLGELIEKKNSIKVRKIIVAGEPGGSVPSIKQKISDLWNGAEIIDHHGMTEVGPVTFQRRSSPTDLTMLPNFHIAEVIDLKTNSEVDVGETGELVLTTIRRPGNSLLRYKTGDLVKKGFEIINGKNVLNFEGGIISRVDDMHVIRGVNVYPSSIDSIIKRHEGIGEYRVRIITKNSMKEIELELELDEPSNQNHFKMQFSNELHSILNLRIPVSFVPKGTFDRFDFKASRWIIE